MAESSDGSIRGHHSLSWNFVTRSVGVATHRSAHRPCRSLEFFRDGTVSSHGTFWNGADYIIYASLEGSKMWLGIPGGGKDDAILYFPKFPSPGHGIVRVLFPAKSIGGINVGTGSHWIMARLANLATILHSTAHPVSM